MRARSTALRYRKEVAYDWTRNDGNKTQQALTSEKSYVNGHLTRTAFIPIAILTFITFVGNFTQLQLSAALPTIVSEFGISVGLATVCWTGS